MRSLFLIALVGCYEFEAKDLSCDEQIIELEGSLGYHVRQGEDGNFDYAPADARIVNIAGSYDLGSGKFSWVETYDEGYGITRREVDGTGVAYENGDTTFTAVATTVYADGTEASHDWYENRVGCAVEREYIEDGQVTLAETGTWASNGYSFDRQIFENGRLIDVTGRLKKNGTWDEEGAWSKGQHSYDFTTEGSETGVWERTFVETSGEVVSNGTIRFRKDSLTRYRYTVGLVEDDPSGYVYEYDVAPDGSGDGAVTFGGQSCAITIADNACSYKCEGDEAEACWVTPTR